ncbi:MAG: T9SS type A sorting domain-containing protein [Saprospiraceae bacterium]|nr:T9SS type A sorting domain-containing protein [Saprospiraceae bacterium]MDZ4705017.1 T9SS type A sorting domain-containing protein [Saprospiraceae bacterium]
MTRTLPSVVLFLFAFSAFAQQYDFAPVGARWTYTSTSAMPGEFPHDLVVESEELFNGQLCRKITGAIGNGLPNPLYVYSRNDSVFFYSEVSENFELLYDFGAEPGETWIINGLFGPPFEDNITIEVQGSFQQPIGDTSVSVMAVTISPLLPFEWGLQIYKGIGNNLFHLPYVYQWLEPDKLVGLRCYSDGQNEFLFVPFDCDTSIIISSAEAPISAGSEISVFPNPATDRLMVLWDAPASHLLFTLYSPLGQVVRQQILSTGSNEVELANLAAGIYYWKATDETGRSRGGKIVKERN